MTTRVLVLHPDLKSRGARGARDDGALLRDAHGKLEEASGLTAALPGLEVADAMVVRVAAPNPGHLFGSGKVEELKARIAAEDVGLVIIDGPVSPIQQRNLEKAWDCKILDRTGLILEIFGDRARTREGVLQVELAHLHYAKSRLVRSWTHLERQRGGLGFVGGPGETQIEADRRAINEKIAKIEKKLESVVKTRTLHRASRRKIPYPIVALVGYTNAGKSTLFNYMTEADVMAKDMLFATLDPTMRGLTLPSGRKVILSDTVGFISDLPTQLVAAFRATLEEVLEADLILHVRDVSHADADAQKADVLSVLGQLGVDERGREAMIEVRNKIDLMPEEARLAILNETGRASDAGAVSAVTGEGVEELVSMIDARLGAEEVVRRMRLPLQAGEGLAWLRARCTILDMRQDDKGFWLALRGSPEDFGRFDKRFAGVADILFEQRPQPVAVEEPEEPGGWQP
ncbi:GTPase HflX [Rhodovulum sp. DZ06]|uniref:GTPase HflX n=1 Tax=Rhodovulum sp. DZ06 TaxID=3425126 RepID=UPI003D33A2A8